MTSINTNQSAMVALETLRGINNKLSTLNDQISTGKKVNNARDNASIWSIAKTMSSDVMSFKTVTESLSLASATVGVARTASESITDLLVEVKSLVTQAQNKSTTDRQKIQTDIDNLATQIQDIVEAASFNGVNLIDNTNAVNFLSSFNRSASGVATDTIAVSGTNLAVGSSGTITNGDFATGTAVTGVTIGSSPIDASGGAQADQNVFQITTAATINEGDAFRVTLGGTNFDYVAAAGDDGDDVIDRLLAAIAAGTAPANTSNIERTNSGGNSVLELDLASGSLTVAGDSAQRTVSGAVAGGSLASLDSLSVLTEGDGTTALTTIETLITTAKDAAASFGSAQKRIDIQSEFTINLVDSLELGVSALTDADLQAASAQLSALQVQQQLGLQSLAIANTAPQTILALFG